TTPPPGTGPTNPVPGPGDSGAPSSLPAPVTAAERVDGEACSADAECTSGNCNAGLCCTAGLCCITAADCGGVEVAAVCEDLKQCQGSRGRVACEDHRCVALEGEPDDSGCLADMEADDCGLFASVHCSGELDQAAPECGTVCTRDSQCDPHAHCDLFRCTEDLPDGERCSRDGDCQSGHCQNGFCCSDGDCCDGAQDCPLSYWGLAFCTEPTHCQGVRDEAACEQNRCVTLPAVDNDSGCSALVVADDCGPYADTRCTGTADQRAPTCADGCASSVECDANAHCDGGRCVPDLSDGSTCDSADQCLSGHCRGGYCCASGDCCRSAAECPGYTPGGTRICLDVASCGGQLTEVICDANAYRCIAITTPDDQACNGSLRSCGAFADAACPTACATSCSTPADCDPGLSCVEATCLP
ncbi:MAG: hypothetical protein OXT09_32495, partial [Myxococcales bacterium]|nr:hypothetical protein [Myxococcales bacterium]